MTVDPLAFLNAIHAAVQAEAEAARDEARDGHWRRGDGAIHAESTGEELVLGPYGHLDEALGTHMARHDPAAVLRRIAADRKLIAAHPITSDVRDVRHSSFGCRTCHRWDDGIEGRGYCDTITVIAEGWGWTAETPID